MSMPATIDQQELPETVISADANTRLRQALIDAWNYRELFTAFLRRDIKVRYRQTLLGVVWVVLQPLLTGVVFAAVFGLITGRFGGFGGVVFFMAGLVHWTAFANGVQMASASLESQANLVSKVYFPRAVVPLAYVAGSMVDFAVSWIVFLLIAVAGGFFQPLLVVFLPLLLLIQLLTASGLGLALAALNAQYRDVKYAVPFVLQMGMFITVLAPLSIWSSIGEGAEAGSLKALAGEWLPMILSLNPMTAVVESARALSVGDGVLSVGLLVTGLLVSLIVFVAGLWFFSKREARLVDIL
jgi:lipopolysaccharide transport system permease protein